jgi:hypothetical protein
MAAKARALDPLERDLTINTNRLAHRGVLAALLLPLFAGCGGGHSSTTPADLTPTGASSSSAPLKQIALRLRGGDDSVHKTTSHTGVVYGKVRPADATVTVNGHHVVVNAITGRFSYKARLNAGGNNFEVIASNPGYRKTVAYTNVDRPFTDSATTPSTSSTPAPARAPKASSGSEERMCGNLPVSRDKTACHTAYSACTASAEPKVRAYYESRGPDLDTIAMRYAKSIWGSSDTWQAAYGGCLAALSDEYDRLYR